MNWVDIVVVSVVVFSALLAAIRGLVREVLGIGTWVGAGFFSVWAFPLVRDRFHSWIASTDIADLAGFGCLFVAALLVLTLIAGFVGGIVRTSLIGGVDRTLGTVFGLLRGAGVLALAYIVAGMAVPLERWPEEIQDARTLPLVYEGALLAVHLLPEEYRPSVHRPAGVHETTAADFLKLPPKGKAIGQP